MKLLPGAAVRLENKVYGTSVLGTLRTETHDGAGGVHTITREDGSLYRNEDTVHRADAAARRRVEDMTDTPTAPPVTFTHPWAAPKTSSALAWTGLGLALAPVLYFLLVVLLPGFPSLLLAVPVWVAGLVVAIRALKRRSEPRWASIVALILLGAQALLAVPVVLLGIVLAGLAVAA